MLNHHCLKKKKKRGKKRSFGCGSQDSWLMVRQVRDDDWFREWVLILFKFIRKLLTHFVRECMHFFPEWGCKLKQTQRSFGAIFPLCLPVLLFFQQFLLLWWASFPCHYLVHRWRHQSLPFTFVPITKSWGPALKYISQLSRLLSRTSTTTLVEALMRCFTCGFPG